MEAKRAMDPRMKPVPGLPRDTSERLLGVLAACPAVEEVWLYGSRAMGRHRPASDIDLTLGGSRLSHGDLRAHVERVGWRLFRR